jgi:hypothetical protein
MVYKDWLPVRKRCVAHRAGVLLCLQEPVIKLLCQAVAG